MYAKNPTPSIETPPPPVTMTHKPLILKSGGVRQPETSIIQPQANFGVIQKQVVGLVDPTTPPSAGRKRKHPAKPGKHICSYCGRGCAKPSVLQKHIRAHTGERPYPCIPCGFSFKTKSNLYKHCKSRSHAIKAGLSKDGDLPAQTSTDREDDDILDDVYDDE